MPHSFQFGSALLAGVATLMMGLPMSYAGGSSILDADPAAQLQRDEADMLARARAERIVPSVRPDASSILDAPPAANNGDAIREQAIQTEIDRRVVEAERQAELDELSARLKVRAARISDPAAQPASTQLPAPAQPQPQAQPQTPAQPQTQAQIETPLQSPPAGRSAAPLQTMLPPGQVTARAALRAGGPLGQHATVVLAMTPGYTGIRRHNPTADPILCIEDTCWISRGPNEDAKAVHRAKALGPVNTLGDRAGACNNATTCVFRNVDLGAISAIVQPIDLRLIRHDRREARAAGIDPTCSLETGHLTCAAPQDGPDYRLWMVAEPLAIIAGAGQLETFAAHSGKPAPRFVIGRF